MAVPARPPLDIYAPTSWDPSVILHGEELHKFGSADLRTTICDIGTIHGSGETYAWPTADFTVEAVSTSANDTAAGSGAREVAVSVLLPDGTESTVLVPTNGTSAGVEPSPTSIRRVNRAWISASGTYGGTTVGGNEGTVTVQTTGGGDSHCDILVDSTAHLGQSQIARYSVPSDRTLLMTGLALQVDSSKSVDLWFFRRENFLTVGAPFTATRLLRKMVGLQGPLSVTFKVPLTIPGETDVWWAGKVATGSADVTVDWEGLLVF